MTVPPMKTATAPAALVSGFDEIVTSYPLKRGSATAYKDFGASPTLQVGSLGPVVAMLQGVLKSGFGYAGAIDGIFGQVTEAVVRHYQSGVGQSHSRWSGCAVAGDRFDALGRHVRDTCGR